LRKVVLPDPEAPTTTESYLWLFVMEGLV
jgi:hypothetical protein